MAYFAGIREVVLFRVNWIVGSDHAEYYIDNYSTPEFTLTDAEYIQSTGAVVPVNHHGLFSIGYDTDGVPYFSDTGAFGINTDMDGSPYITASIGSSGVGVDTDNVPYFYPRLMGLLESATFLSQSPFKKIEIDSVDRPQNQSISS